VVLVLVLAAERRRGRGQLGMSGFWNCICQPAQAKYAIDELLRQVRALGALKPGEALWGTPRSAKRGTAGQTRVSRPPVLRRRLAVVFGQAFVQWVRKQLGWSGFSAPRGACVGFCCACGVLRSCAGGALELRWSYAGRCLTGYRRRGVGPATSMRALGWGGQQLAGGQWVGSMPGLVGRL